MSKEERRRLYEIKKFWCVDRIGGYSTKSRQEILASAILDIGYLDHLITKYIPNAFPSQVASKKAVDTLVQEVDDQALLERADQELDADFDLGVGPMELVELEEPPEPTAEEDGSAGEICSRCGNRMDPWESECGCEDKDLDDFYRNRSI